MSKPTLESLWKEIEIIKKRNSRVENDKAWETSTTRKVSIVILTYMAVLLFFISIGAERPFVSSVVPVIGFFLSTLSLSVVKKWWLKQKNKLI